MDGEAFISHWRLAVGHRVQASKPPHPNAVVVKIGRKWVHIRMVESHRHLPGLRRQRALPAGPHHRDRRSDQRCRVLGRESVMPIENVCFLLLASFVLRRSARFGLRFGPRPKSKPQMTPWHPELGRRKAIPLLVFYLLAYGGPGLLLALIATHGHFR